MCADDLFVNFLLNRIFPLNNCNMIYLPFLFKTNILVDMTATLTGSPSHRSNSLSGGNSLLTSSANIYINIIYLIP